MRLSVFGRSLLSLSLCCCILFGLGYTEPARASAAFTDGTYISASDMRAILGDTISADIADASFGSPEIRTLSLSYDGPVTVSGSTDSDISDGWTALQYSIYAPNLVNSPSYITIDFSPYFSISDTTQFHGFIAVGGQRQTWTTAIPPYQSPQWRAHVSGAAVTFEGVSGDTLDAVRLMSGGVDHYFHAVNADIVQNSTLTFSSVRVTFQDVKTDGGTLYVLIGCPYVSLDSSAVSGTIATTAATQTTTTTTGIDVTVDVDLTETNGILAGLADAIIDGIKSLFLPSEAQLNAFVSQMRILLEDHLGGLYQAVAAIVDFCESLPDVSAKTSITAPTITLPLAGESWELGGWEMQLKYQQFSVLYDGIAWIIDFIATAAFLNMLKKKLEILLVPESEKVN